jgi:tetratricopeptide (TPR) repeat protein
MPENIELLVSNDLNHIMDESRKLAILYKHGFIDYPHFFVALLKTDCNASKFCADLSAEEWETWLQQHYPATGKETMEDSLPLTKFAEHIVRHCYVIVHTMKEETINSTHLLLAMLCMEDEVSRAFQKKGILFEDIAALYYGRPVEKFRAPLPLLRKKPYSTWELFFLTDSRRKELLAQLDFLAYRQHLYEQYDECLTTCRAGLSLAPGHLSLLTLQLYCYVRKREFKQGMLHGAELIKNHPQAYDLMITQSFIYDELGMHQEASEMLNNVLATNPESADALNNKGFNLYLQGQYREAIPYFEKAIAVSPSFAYPYDNLGFVKYKLGEPVTEALALIDKSLELDKSNSYAYKFKGIICMEQGNKGEALKNFQEAQRFGYTKKYGNDVLNYMKQL